MVILGAQVITHLQHPAEGPFLRLQTVATFTFELLS